MRDNDQTVTCCVSLKESSQDPPRRRESLKIGERMKRRPLFQERHLEQGA